MSYIILAIVKVLDNVVITAKSIATYKEKKILSSILVVVSQLLFYFLISEIIEDNSIIAIIIVSLSAGVGNYIAFELSNRFRKDSKWTMVITSSHKDDITGLCNFLAEHRIKYIVNNGYTRKWEDTLHVIVFSKSRAESRLIESYLSNFDNGYMKEVI